MTRLLFNVIDICRYLAIDHTLYNLTNVNIEAMLFILNNQYNTVLLLPDDIGVAVLFMVTTPP